MLILAITTAVELSRFLRHSIALPSPTPALPAAVEEQQHPPSFRDSSIASSSSQQLEERIIIMETTERTIPSAVVASVNKKFLFGADASQHSFRTADKNVTIVCSQGKHDRGSSKIKLMNVVNFKWEQKNYPGRLIACHKDCRLLAYSIRVTKLSKSESMVRVAHLELPERCLIKGLSDDILDLQFSHNSTTECLLAIIERTALHVHQVLVQSEKVTTALRVRIVDPLDGHVPVCDRITWCPYLGDGGGDEMDDFAKQLLVWTRGSTFQFYSISALAKAYHDTTDLKAEDIEEGGFKATDGEATITGSVFSDDGTTLALSRDDGQIRFYQVYQHANDRSPRRLHLWKPHEGKPISSFFFLDNYTETVNNKTIWKHAITCAEHNAEIKVWCCESWACLQTIRFVSSVAGVTLNFKAEIDISSTYLVLTERATRQIYVLQIRKGPSVPTSSEASEAAQKKALVRTKPVQPYIVSIAEYPLSSSVLGFAILYATTDNAKYNDYDGMMMREQDDDDEDLLAGESRCVVIRMFLVQPNNLQDCSLMYEALPEVDDTDAELLDNAEEVAIEVPEESQANSSSVSSASSSSTSSANETTDNNVSHPPSEEDEGAVGTGTTAKDGKITTGEINSNGTDKGAEEEDEEEEDDARLKMAEAAQKLNEAFGTICTPIAPASADGSGSAPTTPASTSSTKVNLMTPDSFSTPASSTAARSEKIKTDETVNPDVLSTLFMLAKATKQHQQPAAVVPEPSTLPTATALEAFVNMVKHRAETADDASGKAKQRKSTNGPTAAAAAANAPEEESATDAPAVPPMPSTEMLASGGSSPSREVQQIMSTKGSSMVDDMFMYSCVEQKDDDFDDDDEDDQEEGVVNVAERYGAEEEEVVMAVVTNGTVSNSDATDGKERKPDVPADKSVLLSEEKATAAVAALKESIPDTSTTNDELALKISAMKLSTTTTTTTIQSVSPTVKTVRQVVEQVEQNDAPTSSNFWPTTVPTEVPTVSSSNEMKPPGQVAAAGPAAPAPTIVTVDSTKQLTELNGKLDSMMELLLVQSRQIQEMNAQFEALKKTRAEEQRRANVAINRLNQTLPKQVETQITQLFMQHALKIDEIMVTSFNKQQSLLLETLAHILPQAVLAQLPERLTGILIQELSTKMLPQINAKLDMIKQSVSMDLAEKFRNSEGTIRDATQRAIRSEPFVKTISLSVQSGMRGIMEQAYQESLRTIILPSYDKTAREMFFQLSATFAEGIKECMHKIDQHVVRVARTQDRTSELVEIIRQLPEKLANISERTASTAVRAMRESVEKDLKGLQTPLLKTIRENIRQEIEKGFEVQASSLEDSVLSVVRSQAQTPAPSNADVQEQIKQYLGSGQINKAFHKALLSNDLSLVEFLLERADHKQVFNPCPLEQTVLLSLIQQISADMSNHNELKQKYLSDAIVNLDFHDPITKEHSPKVMLELINNCQTFMADNPSSSLCTSLKMLVIAAQYMGFKNI